MTGRNHDLRHLGKPRRLPTDATPMSSRNFSNTGAVIGSNGG